MVPNYAHWLTDFRTVFVFALGPFLPMKVIFFDFNGNFNGKMAKSYIFIALSRDTPLATIGRTWPDGQMAINGQKWPKNDF